MRSFSVSYLNRPSFLKMTSALNALILFFCLRYAGVF